MIWTLYYLVFSLPCVYSLDEDLTLSLASNNSVKIDAEGEPQSQPEPGGLTTEHSLGITERESLIEEEEEDSQNISHIFLEYWTEGVLNPIYSIYDSQDNTTELDSDDVEILRFGEVLTSTLNISDHF